MIHVTNSIKEDLYEYLTTGGISPGVWESSVLDNQFYQFISEPDAFNPEEPTFLCLHNPYVLLPKIPSGDNTIQFFDSYCVWISPDGTRNLPYSWDQTYVFIDDGTTFFQIDLSDPHWVSEDTYVFSEDCSNTLYFLDPRASFRILLVERQNLYFSEELLRKFAFLREKFQGFISMKFDQIQDLNWFRLRYRLYIDIDKASDQYNSAGEDILNLVLSRYFKTSNPSIMFYKLDIGPFPKIGMFSSHPIFILLNNVRKLDEPGVPYYRILIEFTVRGQRLIFPKC